MSVYETSPVKRQRTTKVELLKFEQQLFGIVEAQQPMTVRQAFYQASVHGIVEKSERGYDKVQRSLASMRRSGALPWHWMVDNTRFILKPDSFDGPKEAAHATARFYRKALWSDADCRVEVWLEKDALSGVISPVTEDYDVGLHIVRGFASLSFLSAAAETIKRRRVPTYIYHIGDLDPSGVMAGEKISDTIRELAPKAEFFFKRLAVTSRQAAFMRLPSRPTKTSNHSKGWKGNSIEVDAIPPDTLRSMVRDAIEHHLPRHQWEAMKVAEASEKESLEIWVQRVRP